MQGGPAASSRPSPLAATGSLRSDGTQGHGVGSAVGGVVQEWADTFTFLEAVLGSRP
ncbi:MAG: hypothetical protein ACK5PH_13495 [Inhella sp.]